MKTLWMLPVLLTAALPLSALDEKESAPDKTSPPPAEQTTNTKTRALAEKYKVPEADVQSLRDKGLGWGEVKHALSISQKSGKPLDEVMKLRDSGMGWGQIAQKYGFKLGEAAGRAPEGRGRGGDQGRGSSAEHGRGAHGNKGHGR